ncbi:MAG: hypothetical protein ACPGVC_10250 [Salibacteraceae bacterium]
MKKSQIILTFLLLIQLQSFAQKLSRHEKDSLKIELDEMGKQDQQHRWEIMYGTNIQLEIDSINSLSIEDKKRIVREHHKSNKQQIDSLWKIQATIDLENRDKLIEIIKIYGFPSPKRTKSNTTNYILLHFLSEEDFELLNPIFLDEIKKGNMPGKIYAAWYDRILYVNGKPQLYGEYITKYPCLESLEKTNSERKKIGLKKIRKNNCR